MEWIVGMMAVVGLFIVLPATLINAISQNSKHKRDTEVEKMRLQKEILALEIEKQNSQIRLLEIENHHYDKFLSDGDAPQLDKSS
jgi:hypothetical protein